MEYIIFIFFLITCALGNTVITTAGLVLLKYRKPVVIHFLFFEIALALLVTGFTLNLFQEIASFNSARFNTFVADFTAIIQAGGLVLIIFINPYFFHSLLGLPLKKGLQTLIWCVTVAVLLAEIGFQISGRFLFIYGIIHPALFGSILYGIILAIRNFSVIKNQQLRQTIKTIIYVTFVFLPFLIIDANPGLFAFSPVRQPYATLSLPIYYFLFNSLSIILTVRYFDQPPYLQSGDLTQHFKQSFNISDREAEIIEQLLKGLSNKEIGEVLFISPKTVENHIYKIYQKAGVRKRVELVNLINANRAH